MEIIHLAGKVHSNVDPISQLWRRILITDGPITDDVRLVNLSESVEDPLKGMFAKLGSQFKEHLLQVASDYVPSLEEAEDSHVAINSVVLDPEENLNISVVHGYRF